MYFNNMYKNKNNNRIKLSVYFFLVIMFLSCCKNNMVKEVKQNVDHCDTVFICHIDTMVYKLSDKATDAILEVIKGKNISRCGLVVNYDDKEGEVYSFSFPYDDTRRYTKRDTLLLLRTNIFLDLRGKRLPVITTFDRLFSDIPELQLVTNGFNYCVVDVDSQGDLLDSFAW